MQRGWRVGLALLALLAPGCVFDTRGWRAADSGSPEPELGQPLFPDGVLLNFPDAAPMQPQLDVGVLPRGQDQAVLPPDSRPDLPAPDLPLTDLPPPTCGSECIGCCQGSTCLPGGAHTACGKAGAACVDCTSSGQQCVLTACVPVTCTTTSKCPADKVCSKSKCVDPYGLSYRIAVIAAEISAKTPTGGDWDPYSGPDAFVLIKIGGSTWYTDTRNDTLLPVWNQYVDHKLDANTSLRFEVYDSDNYNQKTEIGVVEFTPGVPAAVLHGESYTGANKGVKALKLELTIH